MSDDEIVAELRRMQEALAEHCLKLDELIARLKALKAAYCESRGIVE